MGQFMEASTLTIRHVAESSPPSFLVQRLRDGKASASASVPSPYGYPVGGVPTIDLMQELQWYLERFLDYPFSPETERADRVLDALRAWGTEAFESLFGSRSASRFFDAATANNYAQLDLRIVSDDPVVLSWPWEALYDPEADFLAHSCQVERRLDNVRDPAPLSDKLPRDRVNILLVTARPYENDVRYRSIARPLVNLVTTKKLPVHVEVLRPPTFDQLREHLRAHPAHYHIIHFDGHGAYRDDALPSPGGHTLAAREGRLVFEKTDGTADPISAQQLSALLREHAVPAVVLSACQSAMLDRDARDPFASVAAALLKAGVRSVLAMAYALYVSGARQFLPAFYERLFAEGSVVRAVRAGRQQMLARPERVCARGEYPLQDWCVPVLYQQEPLDFAFAAQAPPVEASSALPEEVEAAQGPYGVVGRDGAMLAIERAMRRLPAAVVVTGLGGVGKTTLAAGFLAWLQATGGLGEGALWFSFADIRSAESVINRMGEVVVGPAFTATDLETRLRDLVEVLRAKRYVVVWDNFESVHSATGSPNQSAFDEGDFLLLERFLDGLRGGISKVLITSRTPENWLGFERRFILSLGGLDGEERWEYCSLLLRDLGLSPNREERDVVTLMDMMDGHPLAMSVVLPRLSVMTAASLQEALRSNLAAFERKTQTDARFYAPLQVAIDGVPREFAALLIPLALHESFVSLPIFTEIAHTVDAAWTVERVTRFLQTIAHAGILRQRNPIVYELHPALMGFLRSSTFSSETPETRMNWEHAFVDVMGKNAELMMALPVHARHAPFRVLGPSFQHALEEADRLGLPIHVVALTQSLAQYAFNARDFKKAEALYQSMANHPLIFGDDAGLATVFHQLGRISEERHNLTKAEEWYHKALELLEKPGSAMGPARTYHQLSIIADIRRNFATAQNWSLKSLAISEARSDQSGLAMSFHQLGVIALGNHDLTAADAWFQKSVTIDEALGNSEGAAITYHRLGTLAQERRDLQLAKTWYLKSLEIRERHDDHHGAAICYQQLGSVAQETHDLEAAESWYLRSLAIKERTGNLNGAAITFHQLGIVAQLRRDLVTAEAWYRKSLAIEEQSEQRHRSAISYHQLGMLAQERGELEVAKNWYMKSIRVDEKFNNPHALSSTYHQLGLLEFEHGKFTDAVDWHQKSLVLREHLGDEFRIAKACGHLGIAKGALRQFEESGQLLIRSIIMFRKLNEPRYLAMDQWNFLVTYYAAPVELRKKLATLWNDAELPPLSVVISQNGKSAKVMLSPAEFDWFVERQRFLEDVAAGTADLDAGRVVTTDELKRRLSLDDPAE